LRCANRGFVVFSHSPGREVLLYEQVFSSLDSCT
jgi:hypothetical protein